MRNKDIAKLCKKSRRIFVTTDENGVQWVGNGFALFPLQKMPFLKEENIYALFDISEKHETDYFYQEENLKNGISLEDTTPEEIELERGKVTLCYAGRSLEPIVTSEGLKFIDTDYINQIGDSSYIKIFERYTADKNIYFAVKCGMLLSGIVMPDNQVITEEFCGILKNLSEQCRIALYNTGGKVEE